MAAKKGRKPKKMKRSELMLRLLGWMELVEPLINRPDAVDGTTFATYLILRDELRKIVK